MLMTMGGIDGSTGVRFQHTFGFHKRRRGRHGTPFIDSC